MNNRLFSPLDKNNMRLNDFFGLGPANRSKETCGINGRLYIDLLIPKAYVSVGDGINSRRITIIDNYSNSWAERRSIDWADDKIVAPEGIFRFEQGEEDLKLIGSFQHYLLDNNFKVEIKKQTFGMFSFELKFTAIEKNQALCIDKFPHGCGGELMVVKFDNQEKFSKIFGKEDEANTCIYKMT